jgi:hypothetical protein
LKIKQTENKQSEVVHPKYGKLVETYWKDKAACALCVDKEFLNHETKKWEKRQIMGQSGFPKMSGENFVYITEDIVFVNFQSSAGLINGKEASSWCFYKVFENTPQYIKTALAKEHATKSILTNDEKEKLENPQAFEETKLKRAVLSENKSLRAQIEAANRRIKELEKKK